MTEFRDGFRLATLVLLGPGGELLGQLPPLKLTTPWFQEIGELVALVDERFGISPVILRLLATDTANVPAATAALWCPCPRRSFGPRSWCVPFVSSSD